MYKRINKNWRIIIKIMNLIFNIKIKILMNIKVINKFVFKMDIIFVLIYIMKINKYIYLNQNLKQNQIIQYVLIIILQIL